MTNGAQDDPGPLGRVSDEERDRESSSSTEGAAAEGRYDPAEGSPGAAHPTGEGFPAEAAGYDEPERRRAPGGSD